MYGYNYYHIFLLSLFTPWSLNHGSMASQPHVYQWKQQTSVHTTCFQFYLILSDKFLVNCIADVWFWVMKPNGGIWDITTGHVFFTWLMFVWGEVEKWGIWNVKQRGHFFLTIFYLFNPVGQMPPTHFILSYWLSNWKIFQRTVTGS